MHEGEHVAVRLDEQPLITQLAQRTGQLIFGAMTDTDQIVEVHDGPKYGCIVQYVASCRVEGSHATSNRVLRAGRKRSQVRLEQRPAIDELYQQQWVTARAFVDHVGVYS